MRSALGWVPVVALLAAGCVPFAGPAPTPTPASLRPSNLLTPRPTLTPLAVEAPTPAPPAAALSATTGPLKSDDATDADAHAVSTGDTQAASARRVPPGGTPVAVSEPLLGSLVDENFYSATIGRNFAYRVYLPPDYLSAPTRRYPVLYMLHGAGGNYTEWTDSFLPEQIDRLIVADQVQPMLVVMPDDDESTYWANWDNGGPRWGDYVANDVVSIIDQRYRTFASPDGRAIGGLSMGGLGALNLAFQHPDIFGVVGSHSPSVRLEPDPTLWFLTGDNFWEHNPIWLADHTGGLEGLKIWLDVGSDDYWLPNIDSLHSALVTDGLQVDWHEFPGPHEAEYWIDHVPDYLRFYGSALQAPGAP